MLNLKCQILIFANVKYWKYYFEIARKMFGKSAEFYQQTLGDVLYREVFYNLEPSIIILGAVCTLTFDNLLRSMAEVLTGYICTCTWSTATCNKLV